MRLRRGVLAEETEALGAWLIHYSTDYVFDGAKEAAYLEEDAVRLRALKLAAAFS